MTFTREMVERYHPQPPVLEVGSCNVNGSVKPLFPQDGYIGVDFDDGPNVDQVVEPGANLSLLGLFNTVVSTEALEHDPRPWVTFKRIFACLQPGGLFIATARGFTTRGGSFGYHAFPSDYWRFSPDAFQLLCDDTGFQVVELEPDPEFQGVFLVARKP